MIWSILAFVAGAALIATTVTSAVRTIVLPHGRSATVTRIVFITMRRAFSVGLRLSPRWLRRHEGHAFYAPLALVMLPLVWLSMALAGYTLVFWALGTHPGRSAFKAAGSALFTIGFVDVDDLPRLVASFSASALALSLLALVLVTYLPSMYGAYSARETALSELATFAGEPADPAELLIRHHRIGALERLPALWTDWQRHFFQLRESHTALAAVNLFHSSSPERKWVPSVAALLDAAALWNAACRERDDPEASLCLRAGKLALNDIAVFFRFEIDEDPAPDDPISVERSTFDSMYDQLREEGMALARSADEAWPMWAGWRVNYDTAVVRLTVLTTTHLARRG